MKPIKVISALLATAILCFSFASCSDGNEANKPNFNFGHNSVVTNEQGEEITTAPAEESTTAQKQSNDSTDNSTTEEPSSDTATTKETTTRKPYTFPTRPTTTAAPSTQATTQPTTQPTTKPTTTAKPITTAPVELPETTTQPTTQESSSNDNIIENAAKAIFDFVNEERKKAGQDTLTYSDDLADAAQIRSRELSENYSHIRPDGSAWHTVSDNAFGENIGYGYKTASEAMNAWMASIGHKANILNENYSSIGIGVFFDEETDTYFWVQLFGN